ncbi:hypothetical protein [Phytomonospora endophytica]|uniref:ABC-type phosphate transport system substrate-binding protein n=1 Tax=Phytomonospora endophytica TaxID=714109 RepID=A0A841F9M5_9ACTN|nr:hypothetical protein [Phytomonospora endophytica]MBB6032444.1 ABC-type phosphate transport system substrate-binding protein [Phytomonospora endophytica]GIG66409.1 hypothetical protein Pen01_27040 [Phytomonospora endophytica]
MKVRTFSATLLGLGAAVLSLALTASPAQADPNPAPPPYGALAGVGSDTTQDALNGFGAVLDDSGGNPILDSWDARGSSTITTKAAASNANCTGLVRPNGSSQGRDALIASENGTPWQGKTITGCVDFARSSAGPRSAGSTYTYVPFGVDAVTVAINSNSLLPTNVTFTQIQRVYQCLDTTIAGEPVTPLLIQSGSGTRQFWLAQMGITEADIAGGLYPCLEDLNNTIQEHDGTVLAGHEDYILPFSVGQYIAQSNSAAIATATGVTVTDRRGPSTLLSIGGTAPVTGGVLNTNFPIVRDVYNVLPTADLTNPVIDANFTGNDSALCTKTVTVAGTPKRVTELFGFGYRASTVGTGKLGCGVTTLTGNS